MDNNNNANNNANNNENCKRLKRMVLVHIYKYQHKEIHSGVLLVVDVPPSAGSTSLTQLSVPGARFLHSYSRRGQLQLPIGVDLRRYQGNGLRGWKTLGDCGRQQQIG